MRRRARSAFKIAQDKPKRVVQEYAAIDQFGELAARKRQAMTTARHLGHQMGPWRRRLNDPYGRSNAFCLDCNMVAVVCTEVPDGIPALVYGTALDKKCLHVECSSDNLTEK